MGVTSIKKIGEYVTMKQIISIILILFLVGCTPQPTGIVNGQTVAPHNEIIIESKAPKEMADIYRIESGPTPVISISYGGKVDIINCGRKAYGSMVAESLKDFVKDNYLTINSLVITNTSDNNIGGCPEIINALPEIPLVIIFGAATNSSDYTDFIRWTPEEKRHFVDGNYGYTFNGNLIDLSRIVNKNTRTDGIDYT